MGKTPSLFKQLYIDIERRKWEIFKEETAL
jgi:hypothetical protein